MIDIIKNIDSLFLKLKAETLINRANKNLLFVFVIFIIFAALLFRNCGLYPTVFGDEYTYSRLSRLLPLKEAEIPGYIYLYIYSFTNICHDGFLDCARILNTIFFVAATPFIYLLARRVSTVVDASLVALLAIIGPINIYTAYYMPEALYFFMFWLFAWFILRLDALSNLRSWCLAGVLLGLCALVKPHAQFLLPALVVFIIYVSIKKEGAWGMLAIRNIIFFISFTFFVKFFISYLFAGNAGLTFFGPTYTPYASSVTSNLQRYLELFLLSYENIKGHVLAICVMYGLPIALTINALINSITSKFEVKTDQKISFFALVILVNLILVVGLFSASIVNVGSDQVITRLHMRYYNFALPLLLIIASSQLSYVPTVGSLKGRAIAALPIGSAILYAIYTHLVPYSPSYIDSPELRGFTAHLYIFYVLSGISFFSLALWVYKAHVGTKVFMYVFMPLAMIFSNFYLNQEVRQHALVNNVFSKAGIFTKQYLARDEITKLVIAGSDAGGMHKTLFYLDNPNATVVTIPEDTAYNLTSLPVGKEWVLVIGDHPLPDNIFFKLPMNGFTLARATGTNTINFKKSSWPGVISSVRGLYSTESWGTWSASDVVLLEFNSPLPEKFTMHLVANAFGPNVGKEFVASVGDNLIGFTLSASPEEKVIEFINPYRLKVIKITIPSPATPKSLGMSDDERRLGIGLVELRIEAKN